MGQIAQIIKYEGDNNTFIWKHPCEDFNSLTQLIVHESQEAIFFMNGQALDMFGAGRHTLETQNIPKIGKLLNRTTGGDTPFHCEVYFINKTVQMAIKWGTDSRVRFIEPTMGIPVDIGVCGELNLAVSDSRKLLLKLVGTMRGIAWGDSGAGFTKSIQNCFKPLISTEVKKCLPASIKEKNIDIVEIDEKLSELSEILCKNINPGFEEYGLTIPELYITNVALPENDLNFNRLRELHTVALQTKLIQAEALVKSARADAEATVVAAERKITLERETTETEKAKREAEREIISAKAEAEKEVLLAKAESEKEVLLAQAEAQGTKLKGFAEAEVMAAQGYNKKDELAAEVQKAYAEGIGNMNISGGGSAAGDIVGLGVGIAAASAVAPQLGEMLKGMNASSPAQSGAATKCQKCGASLPENAKFCLECGEKVSSGDTVECPSCGKTVAKGKFCPECGYKFISVCPSCGKDVPAGAKFCLECGEKL